MFRYNHTIKVIKLYKVGVFQHKLTKNLRSFSLTLLQIVNSDLTALHLADHVMINFD